MTCNEDKPVRISLRDVFYILFYKFNVFIGTLIVIALLVIGYAFLSDPVFKASGSVLLKPFFDSSQRLHTQDRFDVLPVSEQDINTEINIMTSDALLRQVVGQLRLDRETDGGDGETSTQDKGDPAPKSVENAILRLRNKIEIEPMPMSSMIQLSLRGGDPARITRIVNTFLNLYIDRHIDVHRPGGGVDFYSQQTENAKKMLLDAENALMAFQKKHAIIQIDEQRVNNVTLIRTLRQDVSLLKADISKTETLLKAIGPYMGGNFELKAVPETLRTYEVLVDLRKALIPLYAEKERIALMYPESSVEYEDAQNQVRRIEEQIRTEHRRILNGIELDLAAMVNRKKSLEEEIRRFEDESKLLTLNETALNRLNREVEQRKKNYQLYLDIREDAVIQAQRESSRVANVSVVSWASEPSLPVYPQKMLMTGLALFAGLLAGIGGAFAAFFLDHSVKRPEDMERWFQIPVFGAIEEIEDSPSAAWQPAKEIRGKRPGGL